MSISVEPIISFPEKVKDILLLHKKNSKTLGFLPKKAFLESAYENKILIALDSNEKLLGYLLFDINKRGNFLYITHLCIRESERNKGISRLLLKALISKYDSNYRGIRVTCREDYNATKVWEKLGFVVVHEKPGRSKKGTTLFIWWLDFNHPNLFSFEKESPKLKVVLDSNIIYNFMSNEEQKYKDSFALLADWLTEDVEYYITDQLKNDISHNKNKSIRERSNEFVSQYQVLKSNHNDFYDVYDEIKIIYSKKRLSVREESDIRHLTKTINSDASYFITKDKGILKHHQKLLEQFSLFVFRPDEFIIEFSSLLNNTDYNPQRLAGSIIQKKKAKTEELKIISERFFNSKVEKKKEFESKVNHTLIEYQTNAIVIQAKKESEAFYTFIEHEDALEVKYLRHIRNVKNKTIISQLILDLIYLTSSKKKHLLYFSDNYVSDDLESILLSFNFIKNDGHYYRFISKDQVRFDELANYLKQKIKNNGLLNKYLSVLTPHISNKDNLFLVEKFLFPLKILDANIPCFIIPIRPEWAMNLFQSNISEQDLFGGDTRLLFNKENVYYRASRPLILQDKSRILWYISKGGNKFSETMKIGSSSYLNEIEISTPKYLFSKHKHLGVYTWEDVLNTAKFLENKIMAFSFELNENFKTNVAKEQLDLIYEKHLSRKFFYPQAPYKITESMYFDIYKLGISES